MLYQKTCSLCHSKSIPGSEDSFWDSRCSGHSRIYFFYTQISSCILWSHIHKRPTNKESTDFLLGHYQLTKREANVCNRKEGALCWAQTVLISSGFYVEHRESSQSLRCSMMHVWRRVMSEHHRLYKLSFTKNVENTSAYPLCAATMLLSWIKTLETAFRGRIAWHTHHLSVHNQGQHNSSNTMT